MSIHLGLPEKSVMTCSFHRYCLSPFFVFIDVCVWMWMFVCNYRYVYMYMFAYSYVYMFINVYLCVYVQLHVRVHAYVHTNAFTYKSNLKVCVCVYNSNPGGPLSMRDMGHPSVARLRYLHDINIHM